MKVEEILKELTPERREEEIKKIQEIELPEEILKWIEEYEEFGERDRFLWKWVYKITQITTIPMVSKEYNCSLWKVKTLLVMFDALLDDIADKEKNKKLLDELVRIPFDSSFVSFNELDSRELKYIKFADRLWKHIMDIIKEYPRYEEFKEIFKFDVAQLLNTMQYSYMVNKKTYLINESEYWLYLPANMSTMICYAIDLMCSSFIREEIGSLREIAYNAQKMARIGNWISTWEREIKENDFTSGVVAYALKNEIIKINDLGTMNNQEIIEIIKKSGMKDYFLNQWQESFYKINEIKRNIKSTDLAELLEGLSNLLFMHLISNGYK